MSELGMATPLAIYVHVPWCVRKCPYCDFNSHRHTGAELPENAFVERLIEDIAQDAPLAQGRLARSVFFGGGTPSLLSAEAIERIINSLKQHVGFTDSVEITLEANPGTAEASKFKGFRAAGVNRLSLGVQSFQDEKLIALGRIHSAEEARKAIQIAKDVGFENFNIDLMHGLPNQTETDALHDLRQAIDLGPTHLSWYQLTIEQNTEFYRQPPALPNDDALWDIQQAGQQFLAAQGFHQYEVSAYAKTNARSAHNLNYWRYGDYIGVGPGAHGKVTYRDPDVRIIRTRKTRLPKDYLNADRPLARIEEPVALAERPFDYFINLLRLQEPVSLHHFSDATGVELASIEPTLTELCNLGWIRREREFFHTTETGFLYLNDLLSYWLDDA